MSIFNKSLPLVILNLLLSVEYALSKIPMWWLSDILRTVVSLAQNQKLRRSCNNISAHYMNTQVITEIGTSFKCCCLRFFSTNLSKRLKKKTRKFLTSCLSLTHTQTPLSVCESLYRFFTLSLCFVFLPCSFFVYCLVYKLVVSSAQYDNNTYRFYHLVLCTAHSRSRFRYRRSCLRI